MHCHCGTNNRAPRWTFTDPFKPEVRPYIPYLSKPEYIPLFSMDKYTDSEYDPQGVAQVTREQNLVRW